MLVVAGVLVFIFKMIMGPSIPFAQRGTSSDSLSKLEVDRAWHGHCLCLYDLCEAEKVLERDYSQPPIFL